MPAAFRKVDALALLPGRFPLGPGNRHYRTQSAHLFGYPSPVALHGGMRDDIEAYMWRSGLVRQSVEAIRPLLPRAERWLRSLGVDAVPRRPGQGPARAENLVNLFIRQAAKVRDPQVEHMLRNLTGIRPFKP